MPRQAQSPRAGTVPAQAPSIERRVSRMNYPFRRRALRSASQGARYGRSSRASASGSASDRLAAGVPAQLPAQAERQVRQVAGGGDTVRTLQVRDRVAAGPDAIEEVAGVTLELVELVTGPVFDSARSRSPAPRAGPSWPARRPGAGRRTGESLRPRRPWGRASRQSPCARP